MKTLKNHTLIYDNECPMCNIYSKGFTACGMLDENGREAFSEMTLKSKSIVDFNRAKNEIALVDHDKNEVVYGLDSLLLIIGSSFPLLERIARIQPLYWFFRSYILLFLIIENRLFHQKKTIQINLVFLILI